MLLELYALFTIIFLYITLFLLKYYHFAGLLNVNISHAIRTLLSHSIVLHVVLALSSIQQLPRSPVAVDDIGDDSSRYVDNALSLVAEASGGVCIRLYNDSFATKSTTIDGRDCAKDTVSSNSFYEKNSLSLEEFQKKIFHIPFIIRKSKKSKFHLKKNISFSASTTTTTDMAHLSHIEKIEKRQETHLQGYQLTGTPLEHIVCMRLSEGFRISDISLEDEEESRNSISTSFGSGKKNHSQLIVRMEKIISKLLTLILDISFNLNSDHNSQAQSGNLFQCSTLTVNIFFRVPQLYKSSGGMKSNTYSDMISEARLIYENDKNIAGVLGMGGVLGTRLQYS